MNTTELSKVLIHIQSYCKTVVGQEAVKNLKVFTNPKKAKQHAKDVLDLKKLISLEGLSFELTGLDLSLNWLRKVKKNQVLQPLDLNDIRLFLEDIVHLKQIFLNNKNVPIIDYFLDTLIEAEEILAYINVVISPVSEINSDASEELYKFFQDKKNLNMQVQNLLKKIVKDQNLENILQDRFVTTREGRLVLPVISGMRHDFSGIIHDSSQSKQTVFMEPQEVVPVNNKVSELEIKIQAEIEKILREISKFIHLRFDELESSFETLIQIDKMYALGFFASHAELNSFNWSLDDTIYLPDLKHPMLSLEIEDIVGNTIELNRKNRILVLSGPNAGGKTVLLKSIGLACQMATYGLPIASTESAELPFIHEVFLSLGDEQNLEENLSSFGGHLIKLNQAAKLKGLHTLILVDEICGTTEAQEGSALARAFIEEFKSNEVFAVITSHLAPLRSNWGEGVINGSMQYDPKTQSPSYTFIMGLAGESMAIPTAKRYGVDEKIMKAALSYLTPEAQKKFSGLEEIENLKNKLIQLQKQYQEKLKDLEKREIVIKNDQAKLEELKSTGLAEDLNDYQKKIEDLIKYEKIKSNFENKKNLDAIKQQMPTIVKYKLEDNPEVNPENFAIKFPAGTSVFIKSLNRKGIVQSKANSKGEVTVLSESMRIQVPYTDILPGTGQSSSNKLKQVKSSLPTSHDLTQKDIDLRGKTVDEALDELDMALDQAVQSGLLKLKIIHGHGDQDRLKKSVRTFLSRNTFIKSWLSGKAFNQSDGVTIAEILS